MFIVRLARLSVLAGICVVPALALATPTSLSAPIGFEVNPQNQRHPLSDTMFEDGTVVFEGELFNRSGRPINIVASFLRNVDATVVCEGHPLIPHFRIVQRGSNNASPATPLAPGQRVKFQIPGVYAFTAEQTIKSFTPKVGTCLVRFVYLGGLVFVDTNETYRRPINANDVAVQITATQPVKR